MTLWETLHQYRLTVPFAWWYHPLTHALALAVALPTYPLMWRAVRAVTQPLLIVTALLLAALPPLWVAPAILLTRLPLWAATLSGAPVTADGPQWDQASAHHLAATLDAAARLGMGGVVLGLLVCGAALILDIRHGVVGVVDPVRDQLTDLLTQLTAPAARPLDAPYGVLTIERGAQCGDQFALTAALTIGRQDADITLRDRVVSRRHARIEIIDGRVALRDLGSANGAFVQRGAGPPRPAPTLDAALLEDNDVIWFGAAHDPHAVMARYHDASKGTAV